jgi:hypothetical protein
LENGDLNWIDDKGNVFIYATVENIMLFLNCSNRKAIAVKKELVKYKLIEDIRIGMNKPNKIYILNIDYNRTSKNVMSGHDEKAFPEVQKSHTIKTEYIKTEYIKTKQQQQGVNKNDNSLEKQVNELEINENPNNSEIREVNNLDKAVLDKSTNVDSTTLNETHKRFLAIGSISREKVEETIRTYGIKKVSYYLNNYSKFQTNKHNPIGFILKAIREKYLIPQKEFNQHSQPIQSSNFDQRKYDDEFFESLYENL